MARRFGIRRRGEIVFFKIAVLKRRQTDLRASYAEIQADKIILRPVKRQNARMATLTFAFERLFAQNSARDQRLDIVRNGAFINIETARNLRARNRLRRANEL